MKRRDWLLLFAAYKGAPDGLDPIRFQKGLFLFAQRARVPARSKYEFKPYVYGPMSRGIYDDLDHLVDEGLIERVPVPGQTLVAVQAHPCHVPRREARHQAGRTRSCSMPRASCSRSSRTFRASASATCSIASTHRVSRVRGQLDLPQVRLTEGEQHSKHRAKPR